MAAPRIIPCTCDPDGRLRRVPAEELRNFQGTFKTLAAEQYIKLRDSIATKGFFAPVFVWSGHNYILDGHQRLNVLTHENWLVEGGVPVVDVEATDEKDAAEKLLLMSSTYGRVDPQGAYEFTETHGINLTEFKLADLPDFDLELYESEFYSDLPGTQKHQRARRPDSPIDLVFNLPQADNMTAALLALKMGWLIGTSSAFLKDKVGGKWREHYGISFVDNYYRDYDHETHLDMVAQFKPKYTTVRDIMTPGQCRGNRIRHFTQDQILRWAEELAHHAEHVIVIPKFDCLSDIPPQYILGYSVKSKVGSTDLPIERFRGRRVHLLGGSWRDIMAALSLLRDDVVSMSNCAAANAANRGDVVMTGGGSQSMNEILAGQAQTSNFWYACFAMSMAVMAQDVLGSDGRLDGDSVAPLDRDAAD